MRTESAQAEEQKQRPNTTQDGDWRRSIWKQPLQFSLQ